MRGLFVLVAIACVTLVAWGGALWGAFQFDDFGNVVRDAATTDATALAERLTHGLRPLTRLSYFADAQLFGMQAAGFLATNLVLHLATVVLVFAVARRRLDVAGACIAALVFALQPANGEVVAYVSGRSTGLVTPLLLGALLLHDRGRRSWALALFVLACLAKEVALVFPALVVIWEATRDTPRPRRAIVRDVAWYAGIAVAVGALLLALANYRAILGYSMELRPVLDNVLANGRAIPIMLSLWLRPWALSPDHDFDPSGHVAASIVGLVVVVAIPVAAFALRRRAPWLALAMAWAVFALLPTNSLLAKIDLVTEKPLYLAWVGPSLAIGAGLSALIKRRAAIGAVAAALVVCTLAVASFRQASLWRDPIRLWQDATAKAPNKSRCWNNLGMAYLTAERDADAVAAFERALRLDPDDTYASTNLETARLLCGPACP
jgi:tetratricopeptide (TPR) repeat protein